MYVLVFQRMDNFIQQMKICTLTNTFYLRWIATICWIKLYTTGARRITETWKLCYFELWFLIWLVLPLPLKSSLFIVDMWIIIALVAVDSQNVICIVELVKEVLHNNWSKAAYLNPIITRLYMIIQRYTIFWLSVPKSKTIQTSIPANKFSSRQACIWIDLFNFIFYIN